ncbi:hypothetical protein Psi02_01870 [Planotetraspora silvatica]|uniref:D-glucuronyl C5-epimerase C-terminal domain-containing protein n=1 Tax=Planotetraspora silvatica TaxID=234614 RepID=A0A8J3UEI8_9ACTN|nr:D-glucuronyl C5-epimerase family protein [Planotetraspora silvatica]GII43763.1 hypothetical protein Psi02_01870 [Planotetraspora silvatica]
MRATRAAAALMITPVCLVVCTSSQPLAKPRPRTAITRMSLDLFHHQVPALRAGKELYVPFTWLKKDFGLTVSPGRDGVPHAGYLQGETLIIQRYDPLGPWLKFAGESVAGWPRTVIGADGVPLSSYLFGTFAYPVTIVQYGMENYSKWVTTGEGAYLGKAKAVAAWLLKEQDVKGGWPIPFDYQYRDGLAGELHKGWYSGMAQGIGASFLAKMTVATGDKRYGAAALRALRPMRTPVEKGGVLRRFEGRYDWFEEYPTPTPSHVLNGYMFALIGVYDVGELLHDKTAKKMFTRGLTTLDRVLPLYDLSSRTSYDLLQYTRTPATPPNPARWGYHSLHVTQLSALDAITGGRYTEIENRWLGYLNAQALPSN